MSKVLIKSKLTGDNVNTFEGMGIYNKNELVFFENGVKNKIKIFSNKIIIERESDYFLYLEFEQNKKTKGYILTQVRADIDIFTSLLKINENSIYIEYKIFNNFSYLIEFN